MARNPKQPLQTKKHLARQQREQIQTRWILIISITLLVLVVLLVGYGYLDQTVLKARRPVAVVNGDRISNLAWQGQVRVMRKNLIDQAGSTLQFMQFFGNDPGMAGSFLNQLQQIQYQLTPETAGKSVLDQMIDNALIRQEAERRGITVTKEEVDKALQEALQYFPNGTPTPTATLEPIPTSTLTSLQMTAVPPTATATATPEVTPTAESTAEATAAPTATATPEATPTATGPVTPTATTAPSPTPTEYTLEGYQETLKTVIDNYKTIGVNEEDLRYILESQLYRERVMEAVLKELGVERTQEQFWTRHILVADEQTAKDIRARLEAGEDFAALAKEFSTDESNKDDGGNLGWQPKGVFDPDFEKAALALKVGETSQPVKTTFGFHIIQLLGHENRPLSDDEYESLRQQKFQEWLTEQKDKATIETNDELWQASVPTEPTMPAEIDQAIQQLQSAMQAQPTAVIPAPEATAPGAATTPEPAGTPAP